ncbi:MAG TPA: DUF4160 domain-containing protein [Leptolyngbya sp.]|jgi:hypothetical protein|nr:DUF4160 domain-containing protein [Leptolyngbya sp.]
MAKVLEDLKNNLFVYIYSDDHLPPHVHVFIGRKKSRSDKDIKISLGNNEIPPEIITAHPKIKIIDIKKAWEFVADNQDQLLISWEKIHGSEKLEKGGH